MSGIQAFYQLVHLFWHISHGCFGKNRTQHCPRKRLFEEDPILQQGIGNPKIYFSYLHDDTTKSKTPMKNFNVSVRNDFKPLQGFYELTDSIPLICITRNTEQLNKSGMHRRAPNGENVSWRDAGKMLITYAKAHSGKARSPKADKKLNMHKAGG